MQIIGPITAINHNNIFTHTDFYNLKETDKLFVYNKTVTPKTINIKKIEDITTGHTISFQDGSEYYITNTSKILVFNKETKELDNIDISTLVANKSKYNILKLKKIYNYERLYEYNGVKLTQDLGEAIGLWMLYGSVDIKNDRPKWFLNNLFYDYFNRLIDHINEGSSDFHILARHSSDDVSELIVFGNNEKVGSIILNNMLDDKKSNKIIPDWFYNAHEPFIYGIIKVLILKLGTIKFQKQYKKHYIIFKNKHQFIIDFLSNIIRLRFEGINIYTKEFPNYNILSIDINSKLISIFKSIGFEFPKEIYKTTKMNAYCEYEQHKSVILLPSESLRISKANSDECFEFKEDVNIILKNGVII